MRPRLRLLLTLCLAVGTGIYPLVAATNTETGEIEEVDRDTGVGPGPDPCSVVGNEVTGLVIDGASTLSWDDDPCNSRHNVYRGSRSGLLTGVPPRCHGNDISGNAFPSPPDPEPGQAWVYLVTAEAIEEGTPGTDSASSVRALLGRCDGVMRKHVLDRAGFGWDEWTGGRIDTLGLQGFIDEQLAPELIDESTNTELTTRLTSIDPPETIQELQSVDLVRAVYSRRQLEQQTALFWSNHFSTEYRESYAFFRFLRFDPDPDRRRRESVTLHYEELESFRGLAFTANFRQILEASALSKAMIIYLDTIDNVAGSPNENYARELMELHVFGVDNGYNAQDISEIARVFTGWTVCKKEPPDLGSYTSPCIDRGLIDGTENEPDGEWVAALDVSRHDCTSKRIFEGTSYDTTIPDTCATPDLGVNDLFIVLDVVAGRPETREFIANKLLQKFVADTPTQSMIDQVTTAWTDPGNPQGDGDLREVLREVLAQAELLDPDTAGSKVKTPFEHVASGFRSVRGNTNGQSTVRSYLSRMRYLLHENPIPTGYAEVGSAWIDTNNMLERQNFGMQMARATGSSFGGDVIDLLTDNGVPTGQGNAPAIVGFFVEILFGGAITPAERQAAVDYLNTDDDGVPSNYNNARIRETVGFLLGYGQYEEQ